MAGVRDRVGDLLGDDSADPRWRDHLEDLLYDGETVRETVAVADARVVVTSHRVLTFTPDVDGQNFRQVDRPNVVGVELGAESNRGLLLRGIRWSVVGLVLLGAGTVVDVDSILGDVSLGGGEGAGAIGLGGVLGAVQQLLALLRQLDVILQLLGGLVLVLGALAFGAYLLTREPRLVLSVAGDEADDLALPRPDEPGEVVERLERAIFPDGTGTATGTGPGGTGGTSTATHDDSRESTPTEHDRDRSGESSAVDPDPLALDDDPLREP